LLSSLETLNIGPVSDLPIPENSPQLKWWVKPRDYCPTGIRLASYGALGPLQLPTTIFFGLLRSRTKSITVYL